MSKITMPNPGCRKIEHSPKECKEKCANFKGCYATKLETKCTDCVSPCPICGNFVIGGVCDFCSN